MVALLAGDQASAALPSSRFYDAAVGSGRLLLEAANVSVRLYGQDIDPLVVQICQINGALYAPWLAFPFPEAFFPPL